ncbi:MAG: cysteine hydrolase [Candidatus Harrisonbacteria bacterium]|nr:cysteine hydrolase [Candidatus Harrisonbacteria bacterium]
MPQIPKFLFKNDTRDDLVIAPALFIIDAQNCFISPKGSYGEMGFETKKYETAVPTMANAVKKARRLGMPIFFSKAVREASGLDNLDRVHKILPKARRERIRRTPLCVRGTWDSEIIKEITADPQKDYIVEKRRDSAFYGTELEVWLKALGIDTLVFAGIDTAICVESTLRDAFNVGYDVILLSDATASLNTSHYSGTLEKVGANFGLVMTTDAFFAKLKKNEDKKGNG